MRKNKEFLGRLSCRSMTNLVAGLPNTISLLYTVGKYGIDDGGNVKFVRQGVTDWEPFQISDARASGYTTVTTTGNANVQIIPGVEGIRPFENAILVKVSDGCLKEGDKIEVIMGDTREGSAGIITQTVAEKRHRIMALVDPFGGNRYEALEEVCNLEISSGTCAEIGIILPSTVEVGEEFPLKIRVVDAFGNRCEIFEGEVILKLPAGFECECQRVELHRMERGCKQLRCRVNKAGIYRIRASVPYYEITAVSNACKTLCSGEYKLYWGDMHGQNNMASGIGSMEDSLNFAKEIGALDFTGWQGNDFEISDENWLRVNKYLKKYNKEGEFVTFLGYEWSGNTCAGGDHNIYFKSWDEKIHRSSQWLYREEGNEIGSGRRDEGSDSYPISELWKRFEGRNDVMAIPHIGGRHGNLDFHDPNITHLIEIYSHHGIFEWFLKDAIRRKLKVGFIAASDDHTSRMGLSYPVGTSSSDFGATFDVKSGLTAVYASDLSRDSLWEAFQERRCYAATSDRIVLDFKINGYPMGSEINLSEIPMVTVNVQGSGPIDRIELYRGLDLIYTYRQFPVNEQVSKKRVKIVWSGLRTKFRKKSVTWNGQVFVNGGRITAAENYSIDRFSEGIQTWGNQVVNFKSKTSGDEDGMILDIIPTPSETCSLFFAGEQKKVSVKLSELSKIPMTFQAKDVDCSVNFSLECEKVDIDNFNFFDCDFTYEDKGVLEGDYTYYVKVFQKDGNRAWSSPVFVNLKNER